MVSVMYNSIPISLLLAVAQFSDHYNYCIVPMGVREEHVSRDCNKLTNRCIRCFEKGHGRTSCSYARPYELNGTCSSCWLPGNRHGQSLPWHKDTFGGACRANEEFKHVFLAAWRQHKLPATITIIATAIGHRTEWLPKFHCELNPIEMVWNYSKKVYRKTPTIRRYFRMTHEYAMAYRQMRDGQADGKAPLRELTAKRVAYSSHRRVFKTMLAEMLGTSGAEGWMPMTRHPDHEP